MSSKDRHIDDIFRRSQEELKPGGDAATHWEQMKHMLDGQPKPLRIKKTITKRIITLLGVAAVVTTVTYYAVTNKKTGGKITSTTSKVTHRQPAPATNLILQPSAASPAMPQQPTKKKRPPLHLQYTKISEVSDTILQQTPVLPAKPVAQALPAGDPLSVDAFYKKMQTPEELFEIDNNRDTLLFGNDGTVIKIPSRIFMDKQRKMVEGIVTVKLTECYRYADMLAHRLTTIAGQEPLVTGGMVRIEAEKDGAKLEIADGRSPLSVAMPMVQYDPEMQLFLPANPQLTIVKQKKEQPVVQNKPAREGNGMMDTLLVFTSVQQPDTISTQLVFTTGFNWQPAGQQQASTAYRNYTAKRAIKLFDLKQKIKGINDGDEGYFIIRTSNSMSDEKIKQLIARRYAAAGYKRIHIERVKDFEREGRARETQVSITSSGFVASDSLTMNFNQALKEQLISKADSIAFMVSMRQDSIDFFERRKQDSIAYVRRIAFNKAYSFDISKLGWINCDKFMNKQGPQLEFTINPGEQIGKGNSYYHLVFTNIKSVLPGRYENGLVSFGSLPVGEPVQVICVTENNGQPLACIHKTVIGREAMAALKFEPVDPKVFRDKLLQLE